MSTRAPRLAYILVLVVWAAGIALASGSDLGRQDPQTAEPRLVASSSNNQVTISNSRQATWILRASNMKPGALVTGTVKIGNSGNMDADFSLAKQNLVNTGPSGGSLSSILDLRIEQPIGNSNKPPKLIYDGKLGAMPAIALGTFAKGEERTYNFKVSFPSGPTTGTAGNSYQGASTSVDYVWTAVKASGGGK
jgi:spore coat-associated protein N